MLMLRQCCCGCTLKTGTIILGVLNAIGGFGSLVFGIVISAGVGSASNEQKDANVTIGAEVAVFGAVMLLFAICVIVGAVKGKPVLLIPWMVCAVISLIANTVLNIVRAAQSFGVEMDSEGTGYIIGTIIYILLQTYFILVVYSLYRELKGTAPSTFA